MIDGGYLKGACVRDHSGASGRLVDVESEFVRIGWERPDSSIPREEKLAKAEDRYRFGIEILTMDKGWAPLEQVIPAVPVNDVVSEVRAILDEQNHNPFQNKSRLGPGPRGGTLREKKRWECSGFGYEQFCVGIAEDNQGRILRIKIDPEYKSKYNAEYKRFVKNKRRRRRRKRKR